MKSEKTLQLQIKSLSRRLRAVYLICGAVLFAQFVLSPGVKPEACAGTLDRADQVLKARGLIIVDDEGRERILIGAPIPPSNARVFGDEARAREAWKDRLPANLKDYWENYGNLNTSANGMVVLDEKGFDRLVVGDNLPDPNTGKRIGRTTGISINDERGFERGGFGVLNVAGENRVVLGMDSAKSGEALTLSVIDGMGAGLRIGDARNRIFMGNLAPNALENNTNNPFSGYIFRQGEKTTRRLNASGK